MSLASPNVLAAYAQRRPDTNDGGKAARRNIRLKRLEAHRTIKRDTRAPVVVQKADEDLRQQEREMGNDDASTSPQQPATGQAPDRADSETLGAADPVGSTGTSYEIYGPADDCAGSTATAPDEHGRDLPGPDAKSLIKKVARKKPSRKR